MSPGKTKIVGENQLRLLDLRGNICIAENTPFFKKGIVKLMPSLRKNKILIFPCIQIKINYIDSNNCRSLFFLRQELTTFKNK